jgi:hypothetical protein
MAASALHAPRLGPFLLSYRQKEDAMVRDPWTLAVALFAISVIAWVVAAERPPKSPVRIEAARTLAANPDLRLVSERSPYMRTER